MVLRLSAREREHTSEESGQAHEHENRVYGGSRARQGQDSSRSSHPRLQCQPEEQIQVDPPQGHSSGATVARVSVERASDRRHAGRRGGDCARLSLALRSPVMAESITRCSPSNIGPARTAVCSRQLQVRTVFGWERPKPWRRGGGCVPRPSRRRASGSRAA